MAVIFDHAVKYHGKYYPANTPIEEAPEKAAEQTEAPKTTTKTRKKGDVR